MSAIDQYKHSHLGFIECPSTFDFVNNNPTRKIALYELLENIPRDETDFDGKIGDIILGGGSGEAPSFRISIPEAIHFFAKDSSDYQGDSSDLFKAFWTPAQTSIYCEGFSKLGWTPGTPIEFWLAETICSLLISNLETYSAYKNNSSPKTKRLIKTRLVNMTLFKMNKEKIEDLKKRRLQLQEEVQLKKLRDRIAPKLAHLEKTGEPYTIHYENENLNWIYSTVSTRKKDGYFGIHGDFQIDVDDSTAIEIIEMREEEINSGKFREQFSTLIPDNMNVIVCYDGGDPELEISATSFLSHPTKFLTHPDTWTITIDKQWIIEYIWDQEVIRFIQLQESVPTLIKRIVLEE